MQGSATPRTPLIELKDVCFVVSEPGGIRHQILQDISLSIGAGEFVAITGPSGSGKSTLLNLLGCLARPTSGVYKIAGRDLRLFDGNGLAWLRREVFGFVFQNYNLLKADSVLQNVIVPAIYAGVPNSTRKKRAHDLLERLNIADRKDHKPCQLSGGQQQRASVARALMNGGDVILADEPTGALDTTSSAELLLLFRELVARGHTVVIVTHDPAVAESANRQVEIVDGRIVRDSGIGITGSSRWFKLPDSMGINRAPRLGSIGCGALEAFGMAIRSLKTNKLRTLLTLLGVVIGVASVITMLAIGEGAKNHLASKIDELGANLLTITPDRRKVPGAELTFDDVEAIEREIPNIRSVMPELSGEATLRYGNIDHSAQITATVEDYPEIRDWPLASGTFFTNGDSAAYTPVAVLGATAARKLFPEVSPLGRYVLVDQVPFLVIGTMTRKGSSGWSGADQDDVVFIPLLTGANRLFGARSLRSMSITVNDSSLLELVERNIRDLLDARHGRTDYLLLNSVDMRENMSAAMSLASLLLGVIGAISLVVGGIGVMNIMLASVAERTREIGIRVTAGAREVDILFQFLAESTVVSVLGGIIGVVLAVGVGGVITLAIPGVWISYNGFAVTVALSCAVATGMLFGYVPASNAARLDPVDALA